MKNIEEVLNDKKIDIDEIKAPDELEDKLRVALNSVEYMKIKKKINVKIAVAAVLLVLILGYSHDTLAYYGEKIIGYDNISSNSLSNLNELGMGQKLDESYKFSDGTTVTLDGVIYDDKDLYTLYSVKNNNIEIDEKEAGSDIINIKGSYKNYNMKSGSGKVSDDKKQINYIEEFNAPDFYEKKLTFSITRNINGKTETGNIKFVLDRSKAIKRSLKKNINKTINIDGHKIKFKTISVSPLGIEVEGSVDSLVDNIIHHDTKAQYNVGFSLVADGKVLECTTSSQSTGISAKGASMIFNSKFEGLNAVKSLEITNITLNKTKYYSSAAKSFDITTDTVNKKVNFDGTSLEIEKVYTEGDSTYVQMLRKKDVEIVGAGFYIDGREIHSEFKTLGEVNKDEVRDLWRIYGKGENIKFRIKGINFVTISKNVIDVIL